MQDEKIRNRLARKLQDTELRQVIAQEIVTLLAEKPDDIAAEDYCLIVAETVVHELRDLLCGPSGSNTTTTVPEDTAAPIDPPGLNGLLKRLTIGIEKDRLAGNLQMLRALGEAIAQRDTGNSSHNPRVTLYSTLVAEMMELESPQIQALIKGSFLHDLGKIGISDDILMKPSGLTQDERGTMNSHPALGGAIIRGVKWLKDARDVVQYHHEYYDGGGYPEGIKGDAIPVNARIFAVVDVFDALISERPYKPAFSYEKTMQIIFDKRGNHFDPWIVETFANLSRQLYDEMAWESYHVLNSQLSEKVSLHFGLNGDSQR